MSVVCRLGAGLAGLSALGAGLLTGSTADSLFLGRLLIGSNCTSPLFEDRFIGSNGFS